MPNGKELVNELEFEQHIKNLNDRELIEFVARQQYDTSKLCPVHDRRLRDLEKRGRKETGITGGAGAVFGAFVMGAIDYFLRRG